MTASDDNPCRVTRMDDKSYAVMLLKQYRDRITDVMLGTGPDWKEFSSLEGNDNSKDDSGVDKLDANNDAETDVACKDNIARDHKRRRLNDTSDSNAAVAATPSSTISPALPASPSNNDNGSDLSGDNCNIIVVRTSLNPLGTKETPKERRGFNLLILQNTRISPADLSPLARQQISWAAQITHRVSLTTPETNADSDSDNKDSKCRPSLLSATASAVYKVLTTDSNFNLQKDEVRIDIFPKSLIPDFFRAIQKHTAATSIYHNDDGTIIQNNNPTTPAPSSATLESEESTLIEPDDVFSGPIIFTKSASRASYVITLIQIGTTGRDDFTFGIATRDEHWEQMNGCFNGYAAAQVLIQPTDSTTGLDLESSLSKYQKKKMKIANGIDRVTTTAELSTSRIPSKSPVCRAYYKLQQIYDECILHDSDDDNNNNSNTPTTTPLKNSGMDLGASPGGWTQVLHSSFKLPSVLSIDPATLARRVLDLPGVVHVRGDMASDEAVGEMVRLAPFSLVVSDASVDFHAVVGKVVESLAKADAVLKEKEGGAESKALLATPSMIVITLKLPHNSLTSLDRNMQKVIKTLPEKIKTMMAWVGPSKGNDVDGGVEPKLTIDYKVLHLMANSAYERTCVIRLRHV